MRESAEEAFRAHGEMVYKYLMSLCHNPGCAEELTQETFYRAVKNWSRYDESCKLTTWLCQIARHCWYQQIDRQRRQSAQALPQALADPANGMAQRLEAQEEKRRLYAAIHALPEPVRELVHLRLSGECSFAEIGEILGRSETWARTTFYRAKLKLQEELSHE
ncbi:MAG: sigma-70 family RNA polymerase sigma factor [Oscillospiraceae bacterium]|nr:sigma-70 family RNA polymerase sigma factor [Oscillospiraceae bacterium]